MKVLIIGGYGTFGFGIAERLSNEAGLELVLAGRSLKKAKAACKKLKGGATFTPLKIDRENINLDFKPDLIVDASGPFQSYRVTGLADYCVAHGIHYADLSDNGKETAFGKNLYSQFPTDGIFLVFGLSTCPVLSAIGLREIETVIGPAEEVTIGISPSPKAALGRNVIAGVVDYAGQKKVTVLRGGQKETVAGLTEARPETICAPGGVPLPRVPFAVADAADAFVLADSFPALKHIWTGAGTRPVWLHRALIYISRGIADGVMPKLSESADLFHRAKSLFRFGVHRGGMFVRASNKTAEASWHLIAEGDHGPRIPALPVVALIRRMRRGEAPEPGVYCGHELIGLSDLAPEFAPLDITYGLQFDSAELPPYEKIMGDSYARLFPAIQALHRPGDGQRFSGRCDVTRGRNPLSNLVAEIMGFPKGGDDVPVTVKMQPDAEGETWVREFGISKFQSHHSLGQGRQSRLMTEKFGPISIHMVVLEEDGKMRIDTQGWSFFGVPLPKILRPRGDVYETQDGQGRFVFHVDLTAPLIGRLCKYHGWLVPVEK
jgi:hypothetical protein